MEAGVSLTNEHAQTVSTNVLKNDSDQLRGVIQSRVGSEMNQADVNLTCCHLNLQPTQVKSDPSQTFKLSTWTPQGRDERCNNAAWCAPVSLFTHWYPQRPLEKAPTILPFSFRLRMSVCRRDSYPAPLCCRTAVTQLRVCLEGKQEQKKMGFILWLCAGLSLRSSLGARPRRCWSASPVYGRIHRAGENAVWRLPVMLLLLLLRQPSLRRDAEWGRRWGWGWGQPTTHDETLKNTVIGAETAVSQANGGWWIIMRTERPHAWASVRASVRACVRFYPAEWCSLMIQTERRRTLKGKFIENNSGAWIRILSHSGQESQAT